MTCKNCFVEFDSRFCPSCGQKADVHRLSVGHVIHEGLHSITHADKGFLLLVKKLISKPGVVAREYVEGRRKSIFNPLTFLVITSALFFYFDSMTGYMDAISRGGARAGAQRPSEEWMEIYRITKSSGKWLTLLFIAPLYSALSWLFFVRNKYNYAEHFILHSLVFGQAALFRMVVMIPLFLLFPEKITPLHWIVFEGLFIIYVAVAYYQFFQPMRELSRTAMIVRKVIMPIKALLLRILFVAAFWGLIYLFVVVKFAILKH